MKKRLFFSLVFLGKVAIATLLPLIVFALIGRYIDGLFKVGHWFFTFGAVLALTTTIIWLRYLSIKMINEMNKLD